MTEVTLNHDMQMVMLDSNVFDRILQNEHLWKKLPTRFKYMATDIQYKELKQTSDIAKREELFRVFTEVVNEVIPSIDKQWLIFGQSNFSNTRFISSEEKASLSHLTSGIKKHIADALIILTTRSISKQKIIILTEDTKAAFKRAKQDSPYTVLNFNEFIQANMP